MKPARDREKADGKGRKSSGASPSGSPPLGKSQSIAPSLTLRICIAPRNTGGVFRKRIGISMVPFGISTVG